MGEPTRHRSGCLRATGVLLALLVMAVVLVRDTPTPETGGWIRAAGLAPQTFTIDGLRVRYLRAGSGLRVLLLHGFASSIYTWKDVLPGLAVDHEVMALDMPPFCG